MKFSKSSRKVFEETNQMKNKELVEDRLDGARNFSP
jgi:hypothetical protein